MLTRVLIANRGEIALRVVRACHDLGLRAVVAYSEADQDSLPVRMADDAICIGPAVAARSYLNPHTLVSAALATRCDAVHPGYGFLAEHAAFAELCAQHGLAFVGPRPETLRLMSDKARGRQAMQAAGLPIVPGSEGSLRSVADARNIAEQVGYPVMLKPSAGGGGRGVRTVSSEADLIRSYATARAEAETAFGQSDLLLEKYLPQVRHIEIQVMSDQHGNAIALGERDCSVQRRHQKLVAEAPSTAVSPELRERLNELALRGSHAVGYTNIGSLEFLVDAQHNIYFIEMNSRIQVGHAVTELVTGVDLVAWQLRIAGGEPLSLQPHDIALRGHAIECRINAEDTNRDFLPESGLIRQFVPPGGPATRIDTHLYPGYTQPPFYDTLLAKISTWGTTRIEALNRMQRALIECEVQGLQTTIPFQRAMLNDPEFRAGDISTRYVAHMLHRWKDAA
jgi:acetyl-CoA carboxylase biotin carboxylase subunit